MKIPSPEQRELLERRERLAKIAADNSAWIDEFGGLDVRGLPIDFGADDGNDPFAQEDPNFQPKLDRAFDPDQSPLVLAARASRAAKAQNKDGRLAGATVYLEHLDADGRAELATTSPQMLDDIEDEAARNILIGWIEATPDFYRESDHNKKVLRQDLAHAAYLNPKATWLDLYREGVLNLENLTACWESMKRDGTAEFRPGQLVELSDAQMGEIAVLASYPNDAGINDACDRALKYLLGLSKDDTQGLVDIAGGDWSGSFDPRDFASILGSPTLRPAAEIAVGIVFELSQPDFSGWTNEMAQYFRAAGRNRLPTIPLFRQIWSDLKQQNAVEEGRRVLQNDWQEQQPDPIKLDNLDDDAIDNLYHGTLREYAKQRKQ
jgi:hypothetical protein